MWRCVGTKRGVEACVIFPGTTEMLKWSAISWDTLVKVCSLHSGQLIYIHGISNLLHAEVNLFGVTVPSNYM